MMLLNFYLTEKINFALCNYCFNSFWQQFVGSVSLELFFRSNFAVFEFSGMKLNGKCVRNKTIEVFLTILNIEKLIFIAFKNLNSYSKFEIYFLPLLSD